MIHTNNIFELYSNQIIIVNFKPIFDDIQNINISQDISDNCTIKYEYSYSYDGVNYSEWYDTYENLHNSQNASGIKGAALYLRIKFDFKITERTLDFTYYSCNFVYGDTILLNVDSFEYENETNTLIYNETNSIVRPSDCLANLNEIRNKVAKAITAISDFKVSYYKVKPNINNVNYTLKSFNDSAVFNKAEFNITFKNGEAPNSRPVGNEWLYDTENDFEIEIVKSVFHEFFEDPPTNNDFMLLEMNGKMYTVNTVYDNRDILNTSILYLAYIVEYEDSASIDKGKYAEEIDDFTQYRDNVFSAEKEFETRDATGKNDSPVDMTFDYDIKDMLSEPILGNITNNINSMATDISVNIPNLTHNDIIFAKYSHYTSENLYINYKLNDVKDYSTSFWFKHTNNTINLFECLNDDKSIFNCGINNGMLYSDFSTESQNQMFTATGNSLNTDQYYGILLNVSNSIPSYITLSIIDIDGNVIQQFVRKMKDINITPTNIKFFGSYDISHIRIYNKIISKNDMLNKLFESSTNSSDCHIINDCTPEYKGEKIKS